MAFRLLHTADWQIGMTRRFLDADAQARFTQARFESIAAIGRIAREQSCDAVVCCGDVFEHNAVDRKTIARACDALIQISVPVFLLPGNHDPLDAASLFRSAIFLERKPANVRVLDSSEPIELLPGVELVGAPWSSKRPLRDLVAAALEPLAARPDGVRIVIAHGAVDSLSPDPGNPALIGLAAAEQSIAEGRFHYLALGDRHSLTDVGTTGRIRYSGTPEPTDYDEAEPGHVLVVDVARDGVTAKAHRTATWSFRREHVDLAGSPDVELLKQRLANLPDKSRTVVKLDLVGTLTVKQRAALDDVLEGARETLAALETSERGSDLAVVPEDADFADIDLAGFASTAVARLRERAGAASSDATVARDALGLLLRLARRRE